MTQQIAALRQGIRAERELTSHLWTVLNEMRLHNQLPGWAVDAIDGSSQQMSEIHTRRKQVDSALFGLVPGLKADVERTDLERELEWRRIEHDVKAELGGCHG
ncbi:hypothetical protein PKB_5044 [Pseudomonas knackmussii B13]|uniref:Uncharacterized protein n=1 Tax=Pseudomonas knackmussii (strain DSM 6978 / CCUG 54928 / LMG 23759 / B13) TaxID=1301098 RepID=A0A024HP97_PSEKB|nr:hypothetical protein [Pseudomonas knackmussii]CDF86357.1 hypothetical protein PKB_5044 [Pseudomonas knackmussii B13]